MRNSDNGNGDRYSVSRRNALKQLGGAAALVMGASMGGGAAFAQAANKFAPPPANGPRLTIRAATNYAGASSMAKPVAEIFKKFQEDYPNVRISHEATPGFDHQTKIKLDATSNRLPDIFTFWRLDPSYGLDQIADAGRVADLTEWKNSDPFFKGLFDDTSWSTATRKGIVYGIPTQVFYIWFFANKTVFERAKVAIPKTWDEFVAAGPALKAAGEIPWGINNGNDSMVARVYNYVMSRYLGNEKAINIHGGLEPVNTPEMLQAATLVQKLLTGNIPADAISTSSDLVYAKYTNPQRAALLMDGSFRLQAIDPKIADNLVQLDFPLVPGGAQKEFSVERDLTALWYASAKQYDDEERRPYIQELIRRLTSREAGRFFQETAKTAQPQLNMGSDPVALGKLTVETTERAFAVPGNKWVPKLQTPEKRTRFEPLLSEFVEGKYTPQQYVERLAAILG
jgi:raffinose/stachyose/melibiose transport system substrate-binding protein